MCEIDDGERCEVWSETRRKAAKPHRCNACRGAISVGDVYVRHFHAFEGVPCSERMCLACDAAMTEFAAEEGHTRFQPSYFSEALRECISEGASADDEGEPIIDPEDARWQAMLDAMEARKALTSERRRDGGVA